MTEHPTLTAQPREVIGKKVRQLRRQGLLPGIVYGPAVEEPFPVMVNTHEFDRLYRGVGATTLVDLTLDDRKQTVFIRGVDRDPLGRELLHVDFYAPRLDELTTVIVAIQVVGELGSQVDGVLSYGRQDVEVRALPTAIPQQIEVDISALNEENRQILVSDLPVPEGCEIVTPGDEMVVGLTAPVLEAAEPEAAEVLSGELGDQPADLAEGEPLKEE